MCTVLLMHLCDMPINISFNRSKIPLLATLPYVKTKYTACLIDKEAAVFLKYTCIQKRTLQQMQNFFVDASD